MHSVLVVDDEPFVRLSIASLDSWEEEGYDFGFEASNGEEALRLLGERKEIDIVVLDLSMPVMDGIEFLRRLRQAEDPILGLREIPAVIVLSAHDEFHLVREAFKLGAGDYLLKSELESAAIRAALAKACIGLSESKERTAAILERRHIESLKAQVLRDLLSGPPEEDIGESFAFLGIDFGLPFILVSIWIEEFDSVERRWCDEGISRFSDMQRRLVSQLLRERHRGEIVLLRPSQSIVFISELAPPERRAPGGPESAAALFCEDAKEYLGHYLSVQASFSTSPICGSLRDAAGAFATFRSARPPESRIVVLARRAISERFADPAFGLEEASARAGVSPNHLSFEFSRETGETFTSCLTRLRIEEAKRLLMTTDLMVYEVGERVGYPNVEHFSRSFKRVVGSSPVHFKAAEGDSQSILGELS